jgi:hypothetical protein
MRRALLPLAVAVVASVALVGAYAALGGGRFEPTPVADPCQTRDWRDPGDLDEVLEQVVLSGLDGAACELGVSREELVLALRSEDALDAFAARHEISSDEAEDSITEALARAVDDAEEAGALPGFVAGVVRGLTERLPPHLVLELLDRLRGALS